MSAQMVDKELIDVLVTAALERPCGITPHQNRGSLLRFTPTAQGGFQCTRCPPAQANILGQILVDENLASVQARYPDCVDNPLETPGPLDQYWQSRYEYCQVAVRSPTQILAAINAYQYQACEHIEWPASPGRSLCADIREHMCYYLLLQLELEQSFNTDWRLQDLRGKTPNRQSQQEQANPAESTGEETMTDTQGHNLDPTVDKTTVSRTSYKAEDRGWFLASEHANTEGMQCRRQSGPHTLDEIEQMLKLIQTAEDPDIEESILQRDRLVESAFIEWIEDRAMRLAEHMKAETNGNKHDVNRSPKERREILEEIIEASTEYVAWSRI